MNKFLSILFVSLLIVACNSENKQIPEKSAALSEKSLIRMLDDGRQVGIKTYKLTKGEVEEEVLFTGIETILDKMTDLYITNIKLNQSQRLEGSCDYVFRIEPDGMFRMIQEGNRDLNTEHFAPLKEAFLLSAVSHEFKFPETGNQVVLELSFNFK